MKVVEGVSPNEPDVILVTDQITASQLPLKRGDTAFRKGCQELIEAWRVRAVACQREAAPLSVPLGAKAVLGIEEGACNSHADQLERLMWHTDALDGVQVLDVPDAS